MIDFISFRLFDVWSRQYLLGEAGNDAGKQARPLVTALSCESGDGRWMGMMNLRSRHDACVFK